MGPGAAASADQVPFSDPNVTGYIGLCNTQGQQIHSGSLLSKPFVWRAVSSTPTPQGYSGLVKATLYAFTPVKNVDPGDWSGDQLTAGATYSKPTAPTVQATGADDPLVAYVQLDPPQWDGLIQLRILYSAQQQPAYSNGYPAAVIQVKGNTWQQIGGGTVDCNASKAVSAETQLDLRDTKQSPGTVVLSGEGENSAQSGTAPTSHPGSSTPTTTASSPESSTTSVAASGGSSGSDSNREAGAAPANSSHNGSGLSGGAIAGIVIGGLALLGGAGWYARRLRARSA
jgi:hypothetical protein